MKAFFVKNGQTYDEPVGFQKATKMKQAQIKGFMKKKAKRDEIKIQYEYDIPEANPNLAPEDRP